MTTPHVHIAIVGSGFAGLGAAIRLKQAGLQDFVVLERAREVGGTWRDNTYPGCGCDVPSHLYSFSFAPNPDWSHAYARQPEILAYLRDCARRFGITPHLRFGHDLQAASWDGAEARWRLQTSAGPLTASVVLSGHGPLVEPKWPDLPGLEDFAGPRFHSARWDHRVDLRGQRVAVIGTGASAVQFVPEVQRLARHLTVFQRSAPYITPRPDRPYTARQRATYRRAPTALLVSRGLIFTRSELNALIFVNPVMQRVATRAARAHLEAQVADPELRAKLTPDYRIGCKRILVSSDYYPALTQPNVDLVTQRVTAVRPHAIVTADGEERAADVLICGTGFQAVPPPIAHVFRGEGGQTLAQAWAGSPQAYLGTTVTGFPNLFLLVGPNTGLGHTSIVYMIESQLQQVMAVLRFMERDHRLTFDVKPDVQAAWNARLQATLRETVWNTGGCTSWYMDEHGRNSTLWPGFALRFRQRLARFNPADYAWRGSPTRVPAVLTAR